MNPYQALLARNRDFRLLWFGQVVSQLGDWFNSVALYAPMLVKAVWGMAGGALLLMTVMGQRVFPLGGSASAGIGVLYAARGVGAGAGPILTRVLGVLFVLPAAGWLLIERRQFTRPAL